MRELSADLFISPAGFASGVDDWGRANLLAGRFNRDGEIGLDNNQVKS
jgi:hypothetical protein